MQRENYDLVVYIGRFQPPHVGHINTIMKAHKIGRRVLVLCGSANSRRSPKNPFSVSERRQMILNAVKERTDGEPFFYQPDIKPLNDYLYDEDRWTSQVQQIVNGYLKSKHDRVAIIGHKKDESSYYLNHFPNWDFIDTGEYDEVALHATDIRELLYTAKIDYVKSVVDPTVYEFLKRWRTAPFMDDISKEWQSNQNVKDQLKIFTYAVVIQSGHVLLSNDEPIFTTINLPNDEVMNHEKILDSCIVRNLRGNLGLKVPEKVLRGSVYRSEVFDDPSRSERGRIVAHVYGFRLSDEEKLPRASGGFWLPIAEALDRPTQFYEDGWHILYNFI